VVAIDVLGYCAQCVQQLDIFDTKGCICSVPVRKVPKGLQGCN